MHFEGFLKLFFNYHPLIHGFKYIFATVFFLIWIIDIKAFKTQLSYPIALFSIFVLIQFLNPLMLQGKGPILSVLGLFYQIGYLPLFFIGYKILNKERITKLMYWIIGLSTLSAIFAHIQYMIGYPDYLSLMPYQATEFVLSHASSYGPIAFGLIPPTGWYMVGLIFCLYFYFLDKKKFLFSILGLNLIAAILMSGLRIGMLTSAVAIIVFLTFRIKQTLTIKNIKKIAIASVLGILLLSFLLTNVLSERQIRRYEVLKNPIKAYIETRGFTWINTVNLILYYPFGGGLRHANIIPSERFGVKPLTVYTGDNYFNKVLGELGIPGFLALLILFYFITKISINNYFNINNKENRLAIAAFFSILIIFMIVSIYGTNSLMFWLFSAIIINIPHLSTRGMDEENKIVEKSFVMASTKNTFKGSILNKILKTKKDNIIFNAVRNSKIILLLGKVLDIIKNSRVYKIIERIID
jgi:hypothetical protein